MSRSRALIRQVGRGVAWPVRRFFNPKFEILDHRISDTAQSVAVGREEVVATRDQILDHLLTARKEIVRVEESVLAGLHAADVTRDLVQAELEAAKESATILGSYLSELVIAVDEVRKAPDRGDYLRRMATGRVEDIDEALADVLNHSLSATGFAAQEGMFFNPPVLIAYRPGEAMVLHVNERIAELPYMFRALAPVPPGAAVLDVGGAESTVGLSLASVGYRVTSIDPRPQVLQHPLLSGVVAELEEWSCDARFDAVVLLSTIEHLGIGAYEVAPKPDADLKAMTRIHQLVKPQGLLVLTTPIGPAKVDDLQRTYDADRFQRLLSGWEVTDLTILRRQDELTWSVVDAGSEPFALDGVAMVTARRSG